MAIYTQQLKQATDPNGSGRTFDMYVVWEDGEQPRQVAYCSRMEDAERIKALLVYCNELLLGRHGEEQAMHDPLDITDAR